MLYCQLRKFEVSPAVTVSASSVLAPGPAPKEAEGLSRSGRGMQQLSADYADGGFAYLQQLQKKIADHFENVSYQNPGIASIPFPASIPAVALQPSPIFIEVDKLSKPLHDCLSQVAQDKELS